MVNIPIEIIKQLIKYPLFKGSNLYYSSGVGLIKTLYIKHKIVVDISRYTKS